MNNKLKSIVAIAAVGLGAVGAGGCATKTGTAALIGTVGGAAVGAAIGSANGNAGKGALVGGAVGAIGGAIVGNNMDQADKDRAAAREDRERYEEQQRGAYEDEDRRADARGEDDEEEADADRQQTARRPARITAEESEEMSDSDEPAGQDSTRPGKATVSVADVIAWWNDGETEKFILEKVVGGESEFQMTAADEDRLREEGLADAFISQLKQAGSQAAVE